MKHHNRLLTESLALALACSVATGATEPRRQTDVTVTSPGEVQGCLPASSAWPDPVGMKNRFLSITAGDPGRQQAIRVVFIDLPAPHDVLNGLVMWVGPPHDVCNGGSVGIPEVPEDCSIFGTFLAAPLQCAPFYTDWSTFGQIEVYGKAIIPESDYAIQVVDQTCPIDSEAGFSTPLFGTTPRFADVAGHYGGGGWSPPDGEVTMWDIVANFAGFSSAANGPPKAWLDLEPADVDFKLNATDYTLELDAFLGGNLPFVPQVPPVECSFATPDCGNGILEPGEACDDGGTTPGDGCDERCRLELCGNAAADPGEACDDGNTLSGDGCDGACRLETTCGNGQIDHREECDDANLAPGDGCDDHCRIEGSALMSLVPVGNHADGSLDTGVTVNGNEMILPQGGHRVFLELQIRDWDPDDQGRPLVAYQAVLDEGSYTSVTGGTITPAHQSCGTNAECIQAFGGACQFSGEPCTADSDCPFVGIEECSQGWSTPCRPEGCAPAFISRQRHDFSLFDSAFGVFNLLDLRTQAYRLAATTAFGLDPIPDPHIATYAGTFVIDVPVDATGSFTIDLRRGTTETFLVDGEYNPIGLAAIEPAIITLPAPCCLPDDSCGGTILPSDCRDLGGRLVGECGTDANGNGTPDACETAGCCDGTTCETMFRDDCVAGGGTVVPACYGDNDSNGTADACECSPPPTPLPDMIPDQAGVLVDNVKSRAISFSLDGPPRLTAVEVTFVDLPAPFDVLNGTTAWVGPPEARSENGSSENPIPGWPNYQNASLQCSPHYEHWSRLNTVHVTHEWIVPGGVYALTAVQPQCDAKLWGSFPLIVNTGRWADSVGAFDPENTVWLAADGSVDVATDVVAALDKFGSLPSAPVKIRLDIDYPTTDGKINITDVTYVLDAFAGATYPFAMQSVPCP